MGDDVEDIKGTHQMNLQYWNDRYSSLQASGVVGSMAWGEQHRDRFEKKERIISRIIKPVVPCRRFLDFGCGRGQHREFIQRFYNPEAYYGADIVECVIEANKIERPKDYHYLLGDKENIPGDFDVIWAFSVLQHLTEDEAKEAIYFFSSRLSNGGRLVMINCADPKQKTETLDPRSGELYASWMNGALLAEIEVYNLETGEELIQCQW